MNILDLIQSAGAIQPPTQAPVGEDVTVQAAPKRTVQEDTRVEPSLNKTQEVIPRHGLFGVKGTLRDVLGAVGDAFLVGSGRQPIYRPVREKELLGNAIYGYNDDPVAAIDRAAIVDPQAAMELQRNYTRDKQVESSLAAQKIAGQQKAASVLGSWARSITPESYNLVRDKMQAYSDQNGLGYDFPTGYDKDYLGGVFTRGMTPDQLYDNDVASERAAATDRYNQGRLELGERTRQDNDRYHREIIANKPKPQPRVDHGPGLTNVDATVAAAVANGTATPNQKAYYQNRLVRPQGKSGGSVLDRLRAGNPNIPPPPGGSIRKIK